MSLTVAQVPLSRQLILPVTYRLGHVASSDVAMGKLVKVRVEGTQCLGLGALG